MMTIAQIRELAEDYARKYNPDNLAPFPYENVLGAHDDLDVHFVDLEDSSISGATLYKDDHFTILVNTEKPFTRQHFTLGHELGHYFLHQDSLREKRGIVDGDTWMDEPNVLFRVDDAASAKVEKEASNFAAALLMPEHLVVEAWDATHSIEDCARIFQLSVVAMSIRLIQLGLVSE